MTTLKITAPSIDESLLVRCDLSQAAALIQVDYSADDCGWDSTQYQCADARHTINGLAEIGRRLLLDALEERDDTLKTQFEIVNDNG